MKSLRLLAFDEDDLSVVSAHLQDAVVQVGDMAFLPSERRFAAVLSRFDWTSAGAETPAATPGRPFRRCRAGLRFEHVTQASAKGIAQEDKTQVLALLAIGFERAAPPEPEGHVLLLFSGGATVRLAVEALEVELRDLDATWSTRRKPAHEPAEPDRTPGQTRDAGPHRTAPPRRKATGTD